MRKAVIALLILAAPVMYAAKGEKVKYKEKRFEPVTKALAEYAGSYRGPSDDYGLVLEVHDGKLGGTYVELGRVAILGPIHVDGSSFTATASFADGSWRTVEGMFADRILNGARAFGVRLYDIPVEGLGIVDPFFEVIK